MNNQLMAWVATLIAAAIGAWATITAANAPTQTGFAMIKDAGQTCPDVSGEWQPRATNSSFPNTDLTSITFQQTGCKVKGFFANSSDMGTRHEITGTINGPVTAKLISSGSGCTSRITGSLTFLPKERQLFLYEDKLLNVCTDRNEANLFPLYIRFDKVHE